MPLYDFRCMDCGAVSEILLSNADTAPHCTSCGSAHVEKLLSAPSTFSGKSRSGMPGPGDTACCGSTPGHGSCAGPGSCCGKF